MAGGTAFSRGELPPELVRAQVERVLAGRPLAGSKRLKRFLHYVVEETLAGREEHIRGKSIYQAAYDRDESFDPLTDPLVRVDAGRLRRRLADYYDGEGQGD